MISIKEVEKAAQLARIKLTAAEKENLQKDLSAVLDYIGQLSEADTGEVMPTVNIGGAVNVIRADEPAGEVLASVKEMIGQFPHKKGDFVKVKTILK